MTIDPETLNQCIQKGLRLLAQEQKKAGYFVSLTSADAQSFGDAYACQSVFSTTLILSCLESVQEEPLAEKIRAQAAKFLLGQKSPQWTFNYWRRESADYRKKPYPDDLDDTACALAALFQYDRELIGGEALAHAVEVLTALEAQEGGPYRTWVVAPEADPVWKDVDLAVNGNIAFFLSLQDIALPNVGRLFDEAIAAGAYSSPYYVGSLPIVYFLARSYQGERKNQLVRFILGQRNAQGAWANPQETALALSALVRLGVPVSELAELGSALVRQWDDAFCPYPFYTGINPRGDNRKYVAGSTALTLALCVEALGRYLTAQKKEMYQDAKGRMEVAREHVSLHGQVADAVRRRIVLLPESLRETALAMLEETVSSDTDGQITLLPWHFRTALGGKAKKVLRRQLVLLGAANLYGWMAYTAYDNILDSESDARRLPAANMCLREVVLLFASLFASRADFLKSLQDGMNRMEAANAWEVSQCQCEHSEAEMCLPAVLPDYGNYEILADRSHGHILGPLAVCALAGFTPDSSLWKHTLFFFRSVLVARQLNDDMHDWEEDLRRGRINSVGADILGLWMKKYPVRKSILWERDISELREIAWRHAIPHACATVIEYVEKSERALSKLALARPGFFRKLLERQRVVAEKTLKEQEKAVEFLRVYHEK